MCFELYKTHKIKEIYGVPLTFSPAAYDTIKAHFEETGMSTDEYDLIVTGDLGKIGSGILVELLAADGIDISGNYKDCGCMIYNVDEQDVHAGASGCGCIASVLCGYLLKEMRTGKINSLLAVGTGALLSPTSTLQGESVPGIAHAVSFKRSVREGAE